MAGGPMWSPTATMAIWTTPSSSNRAGSTASAAGHARGASFCVKESGCGRARLAKPAQESSQPARKRRAIGRGVQRSQADSAHHMAGGVVTLVGGVTTTVYPPLFDAAAASGAAGLVRPGVAAGLAQPARIIRHSVAERTRIYPSHRQ